MTDEQITVSVENCARCGEYHDNLIFDKLARPSGEWTHWCLCPNNFEPIMLAQC